MTRTFAALVIVLSLIFAACGGDGGDSPEDAGAQATQPQQSDGNSDSTPVGDIDEGDSSGFHACSLFSGEELGELLGVEMSDGRDYLATAADATNCTWEGDIVVFVEVLLEGGQAWYDAIHFPGVGGGDTEPVEGIGDEATWDNFVDVLDVVDDDRFISVQIIGGANNIDDREAALVIATLAFERLP